MKKQPTVNKIMIMIVVAIAAMISLIIETIKLLYQGGKWSLYTYVSLSRQEKEGVWLGFFMLSILVMLIYYR